MENTTKFLFDDVYNSLPDSYCRNPISYVNRELLEYARDGNLTKEERDILDWYILGGINVPYDVEGFKMVAKIWSGR